MSDPEPRGGGGRIELDELTLRRAQRGDRAAFRELVRLHERPVFALLSRMLVARGAALVEDLAQETFLRVFRALPDFGRDGRLRLSSWILTIATHVALDELRRHRPPCEPYDESAELLAAPDRADGETERRVLHAAIQRAVAELGPDHRAAFLLREIHGLEYQEIADALGIDLGTVKSRLFRARAALRLALSVIHDGE